MIYWWLIDWPTDSTVWLLANWLKDLWLLELPGTDPLTEWFQPNWTVQGLTNWLSDLWLADWLTDWFWVYWVMHWPTEIGYDWLYYLSAEKLTEWCSSDLRAAEAYWPMHSLTENNESTVMFAYRSNMNGTQPKYDCTPQLSAIQIKFHDHSSLFHQSLMKKLVGVRRCFWQLGTRSSGRCRCREVETRSNVWTVRWDKKSGLYRVVAVAGRRLLVEYRPYITIAFWLCGILTDQLLLDWHIDVLTK